MVHYMSQTNQGTGGLRRGLIIGTLAASTLAAAFFGTRYYQTRSELYDARNRLSNAETRIERYEGGVEQRLRETCAEIKEKAGELVPEIRKDAKRIAVYMGIGVLLGIGAVYVARKIRGNKR